MTVSLAWQSYFEHPIIAWFNIATQNPAHAIVCHNGSGVYQIYAWSLADNTITQRTFNPNGTQLGAISTDGLTIYYLEDAQGGQIGHLFRVGFDGQNRYDLTADWVAYTSFYITESYSGAFYGFMTANQHGFQMFVVDAQSGATPHLRFESEHLSTGPFLSHNAEVTVIASTENEPDSLHFGLESYDTKTGQRLHTLWDGVGTSIQPVGFANRAFDMRFLATMRQDEWERPFLWNTRTGERTLLSFGDILGDITPLDWSSDGETLLVARLHLGRQFLHTYNLKTRTLSPAIEWAKEWHITHAHLQPDLRIFALAQNMVTPPQILLDGKPVLTLSETPEQDLRYVKHLRTDGAVTSAWGLGAKTDVIYLHADPHDVLANQFMPSFSAWHSHNQGILGINYRGSSSFGRTQKNSIYGNIGTLEIEDIAEYVRETSPTPKTLFGSAYGGFLALRALTQYPHLFKGAIVMDAIADWATFYETVVDEDRSVTTKLMGGSPAQVPQRYQEVSPLFYAEKVQKPIFILHGRNNPHYPAEQMQHYITQLEALGKPVHVTWYDQTLTPQERMAWVLSIHI